MINLHDATEEDGFSLIELMIVVCVIAIVAAFAGIAYSRWMRSYNVEREIRELHADLLNARAKAVMRNRFHFVSLTATGYRINEDLDPWPDGDGQLTADDNNRPSGYMDPIPLIQKSLNTQYPITWSGAAQITFDTKGFSDDSKVICSNADVKADNNCIVLSGTSTNLGRLSSTIPQGGACDTANCVIR
jgi:prepilin-type N-terminal cleavage/methylation domain-containing protein